MLKQKEKRAISLAHTPTHGHNSHTCVHVPYYFSLLSTWEMVTTHACFHLVHLRTRYGVEGRGGRASDLIVILGQTLGPDQLARHMRRAEPAARIPPFIQGRFP